MDDLDRHLLTILQESFPLVAEPFRAIGERIGLAEPEAIERLREAKAQRTLRQICGIFDTRSVGYQSSLVATRVAPEQLSQAVQVINGHPGVTHNYERNHEYNLWYTIAVPPASSLEGTIQRLHELSGAEQTRVLPTLHLFKIGVTLDMTGEQAPTETRAAPAYSENKRRADRDPLTKRDAWIIRELQEDLPLEPRPFDAMAERLGMPVESLLERARWMLDQGYLRRFAGILYHRRAGFKANAMGVWAVPEDRVLEVGNQMASFKVVSHCYRRPTYPDWPYNLFTMIHGRSVEECEDVLGALSAATGIAEYRALFSTREFKKVRLLLFTSAYAEWEAKHLAA